LPRPTPPYINNGLYAFAGDSATAREAAWANLLLLPITKESKVYFGFNVAGISSLTVTTLLVSFLTFGSSRSTLSSEAIVNSILYFLEEMSLRAFIIRSLYLVSKISLVKLLGTPNFRVNWRRA
jgi:O-antigen ligase